MEQYTDTPPLGADVYFYPKGIHTNPPIAGKITQGLPGGTCKIGLFRNDYTNVDSVMAYHVTDPMIKDGLGLPSDRVKKNGTWEFAPWHAHLWVKEPKAEDVQVKVDQKSNQKQPSKA